MARSTLPIVWRIGGKSSGLRSISDLRSDSLGSLTVSLSDSVPVSLGTRDRDSSPPMTACCRWLRIGTVYAGWSASRAGKNLRRSMSRPV